MEKRMNEQLIIQEIENLDSLGNKLEGKPLSSNQNSKTRPPKWEREEVVLLVSEYYRTKNLSKEEKKRSMIFISKLLREKAKQLGLNIDDRYRNIPSIMMKFGNMKALDPEEIKAGHSGLKNVSALEKAIVDEYHESPIKINQEAYLNIMKYVGM